MGQVRMLSGGRTLSIWIPRAVQAAVPAMETLRYPSDLAVSGSKQSAGMTERSSFALGNSVSDNDWPLSPLNAIPDKSIIAPEGCSGGDERIEGITPVSASMATARNGDERVVAW